MALLGPDDSSSSSYSSLIFAGLLHTQRIGDDNDIGLFRVSLQWSNMTMHLFIPPVSPTSRRMTSLLIRLSWHHTTRLLVFVIYFSVARRDFHHLQGTKVMWLFYSETFLGSLKCATYLCVKTKKALFFCSEWVNFVCLAKFFAQKLQSSVTVKHTHKANVPT